MKHNRIMIGFLKGNFPFRRILIIVLLFAIPATVATAQNNNRDSFIPTDSYIGIESAAGTCQTATTMSCYGNTFVLTGTSEAETRHLTVSLNYSNYLPNCENNFVISGGTWSLVVMREGKYAGTLYGNVTDGSIAFPIMENESDKKLIYVNLQITGELGSFENKRRKENLAWLNLTTSSASRQTAGHLFLTF